jgi:hypothetical protein
VSGEQQSSFCPECGSAITPTDKFCSSCGHGLQRAADSGSDKLDNEPRTEPPAAGGDAGPKPTRRRSRIIVAGALAACLAGVAAALLLTGVIDQSKNESASANAGKQRAHLRAQLGPPFNNVMDSRDAFFRAERKYLAAMSDARRTTKNYQRQYAVFEAETKRIVEANQPAFDQCAGANDIPCPDPTYPDAPVVPSVGRQITQLRDAGKQLGRIHAQLVGESPPARLKALQSELLTAVTALQTNAPGNANILTEAVAPGNPTSGEGGPSAGVDKAKIETLSDEDALPAIGQMNVAAVAIIRALGLPLANYDVPGGRDLDTSDHTTTK